MRNRQICALQTCSLLVQNLCGDVVISRGFINKGPQNHTALCQNQLPNHQSYTYFVRTIHKPVANFVSVLWQLYTFYTGPITKTTMYIN